METLTILLVAFVGWSGGVQTKPTVNDARIKTVVAYFEKHAVKLKLEERGYWVVTDPKGDGYEVIVHLRTFPAEATEQQMLDTLKTINLAYMLNVPSRVAMSYPGLRHTDPTKKPKLDQIPVVVKLKTLFKEYQPPESKK